LAHKESVKKMKKTRNSSKASKFHVSLDPVLAAAIEDDEVDVDALTIEQKQDLKKHLVLQLAKKASVDFMTYVEMMADEVLPEGFVPGRHINIMAKDLQEIEKSVVATKKLHRNRDVLNARKSRAKRSQYFLPPRSMKSKLVSVLFVSWFLGRNPTMDVLQLGHSTKLCIDTFGRAVLEILHSPKFHLIFPNEDCRVKRTARSAQSFQLVGGGKYFTTGAGSKIAGRGAALLLSDDVVSEQDAYSESVRTKINEWYIGGARSRMQSYGAEIIVNTRWSLEDLSGYLVNKDKNSDNPWTIIEFPSEVDARASAILGLPVGSSFWPELWPVEIFHEMRRTMAPSKYAAMYLQKPIPDEGNIIPERLWQEWEDVENLPMCEAVIVSLDTAFSEKQRADYSAYTVWGVFFKRETGRNGFSYIAANLILLGSEKGRWTFPQLCDKVEHIKEVWNPDYYIIENKASGQSLIQELRLKQYPIVEFNPGRDDKITRANASVPTFMSGKVFYPKDCHWALEVVGEVSQFPSGVHDDVADTVFQAIIWFRQGLIVPSEGEVGWEDQLEEEPIYGVKPKTYWSAIAGR
jgi:predicted phage terminase large subunit-like protein